MIAVEVLDRLKLTAAKERNMLGKKTLLLIDLEKIVGVNMARMIPRDLGPKIELFPAPYIRHVPI